MLPSHGGGVIDASQRDYRFMFSYELSTGGYTTRSDAL